MHVLLEAWNVATYIVNGKFTIRKCKHMYAYPSSTYVQTANMTLSEILLKVALNIITPNPNGEYIS